MRDINKVVLHCSDSEFGDVELIDKWHREERGFDKIGYHFVILNGRRAAKDKYDPQLDGIIETGRPLEEVGAHCYGHNSDSIGICLVGGHHFSIKQLISLGIVKKRIAGISVSQYFGHYEFDKLKTCPNMNMAFIRKMLVG